MSKTITIMTDFGSQDGYVGAMIGKLMKQAPEANIIEISHDISPQSVLQAAFSLKRYAAEFPDETVHMVVVDPGVGSARKALALRCDSHWLVGPDNGVLSLAAAQYKKVTAFQLKSETHWWSKHTSFDGLALFTPACACLHNDAIALKDLASPIDNFHQLTFPEPELLGQQIVGQILGFDRFGNALSNITQADIPRHQVDTVFCQEHSFPFRNFYCEASANSRVAIINSDGLLELAVYQGSAEKELDLQVGQTVTLQLEK